MKTKTVCKQRESSFELMRLVSMFLIVLYHLFLFFLHPLYENDFYKAIQIPLHIGVLLFVLISGYFGIKATPKGLLKLIGMMFVYYLPIQFVYIYLHSGGGFKRNIKNITLYFTYSILVYANLYLSFHFRANNQSVSERCTEKNSAFGFLIFHKHLSWHITWRPVIARWQESC